MKLTLQHFFDAAHRLEFYNGPCKNLHGHRWEVLVEIDSNVIGDMIIDFTELKNIINKFDHACILKICDENKDLIKVLEDMNMKLIKLNMSPTAENLVKVLHEDILVCLLEKKLGVSLSITLWESPKAGVQYHG